MAPSRGNVAPRRFVVPAREAAQIPLRMKSSRLLAILAVVLLLSSPFWLAHIAWRLAPWKAARVRLVDYSVPFVNGREHRGAIWLLNHERYRAPGASRWALVNTHAGYDPNDRGHFRPISSLDLSSTDWLFVTDTYGVYEDDLKDIEHQVSHMDYSRRIVGGLSSADVDSIVAHAMRGRHTFLEFNSFEEPTTDAERARVEALFGVRWTGWIGRTFLDLRDTTDVPRWLPREFKKQYGDVPMPRGAVLALVDRSGRLLLTSAVFGQQVAPEIHTTPHGDSTLAGINGGVHYYYWFPVLQAAPGTEVFAHLVLPATRAMDSVRALAGIPDTLPLLTRRIVNQGHQVYLAADLSDPDFDPGVYAFAGLARVHARLRVDPRIYNSQRVFWGFYVPAVGELLEAPFRSPLAAVRPPS